MKRHARSDRCALCIGFRQVVRVFSTVLLFTNDRSFLYAELETVVLRHELFPTKVSPL